MNYRIYSVALAISLLTACGDKPTPLPQPTPTPEPTPPAYKDYEGYTLIFNQGLAAVLTSQPDGVGVASSLKPPRPRGEDPPPRLLRQVHPA